MGLVKKSSRSPRRVAFAVTTAWTCSKYLTAVSLPKHALVFIFNKRDLPEGISLKSYNQNEHISQFQMIFKQSIWLLWSNEWSCFAMVSCRNGLPRFSQSDHCSSIQNPKSKQMVELQTDSIHRPMETTLKYNMNNQFLYIFQYKIFNYLSVKQWISFRRQDCQVLNIPPRQSGTANKGQDF